MNVNPFFQAVVDEANKRTGGGVLTDEMSIRGLPAPGLSLQYLLHSTVVPFGHIIGLAGATKAMKSSYGFGLLNLAISHGGGGKLIETEHKINMEFYHSVIPREAANRAPVVQTDSIEESQEEIQKSIDLYKKKANNAFPYVIGLDSLAGSDTESSYAKMEKEGHSSRNFPEAALLWSPFFKKLSKDIAGTNILFYFTNHLKEKPQEVGGGFGKKYTKQGGVAQDFHALLYLWFTRIGDINQANREGKLIQIKADKCGLGPDGRKIEVPVLWDFVPDENGEPRQRTWWDWNASTAKLLVDKHLPARVQSELDVVCTNNRYSSEGLGASGLTDTEFGAAVIKDSEYVTGFRKLCGYRDWPVISVSEEAGEPAQKKKKPSRKKNAEPQEPSEDEGG